MSTSRGTARLLRGFPCRGITRCDRCTAPRDGGAIAADLDLAPRTASRRRLIMQLVLTDHSVRLTRAAFALLVVLAACTDAPTTPPDVATLSDANAHSSGSEDSDSHRGRGRVKCDRDNGGITLPRG